MGKGSGAKAGSKLLGVSKGSGSSTGPQEGIGAGTGKSGTPEDTNFKKDSLHPRELNPGDIVGTLPGEEDAPTGEATVPVRTDAQTALQRMAEKVDTDVLPAEYRDQVLKYMESLRARVPPEGAAVEGEKGGPTEGR